MSRALLLVLAMVGFTACASAPDPPGPTLRTGTITTPDGVDLHYEVLGSGADTVVIPLGSWWRPHVTPLTEGRALILYDPRDRGRSDAVPDSTRLGLEYEIRDLEAVRRFFGLERMDLIGWSYLGGVSALYAARHPDRVDHLVLHAPVPPRFHPHVPGVFADMASRADTTLDRIVAEAKRAGLQESNPVRYCELDWRASVARQLGSPEALNGVMSAGFCELPNEWPANFGFRHVLRSMGQWDWREQVAAFTGRVLVVHGARDNMPLAGSREWVAALPDARLLVVEEAGHYPLAEAPAEVTEAIDRFLADGSARSAPIDASRDAPVTVLNTRLHELASSHVDQTYQVQVALPDGYLEGTERYPVIYVLDADRSFGMAVDIARWLRFAREMPPAVVVGIAYGQGREDWWQKRSRDYTPTVDHERIWGDWPLAGGAGAFASFLEEELFPFIEAGYPVKEEDRTVVGLSFGGLFGAHVLFDQPELFQRYVLISPALAWDQRVVFQEEAAYAAGHDSLDAVVYTAVAGRDDEERALLPWREFVQRVEARGYRDLRFFHQVIPNETHISVFPVALGRGLRSVFEPDPLLSADTTYVDPPAELERLAAVEHLTEGVSVGPDGTIYFTEIDLEAGGRLWQYDPRTGETAVVRRPGGVTAGSAIDCNGDLLTAEVAYGGGRRISRYDLATGEASVVMDRYQDRPIHGANDLTLDDACRIYFTEYVLLGPDEVLHRQGSGVYRVDPDGTIRRIVDDLGNPNGIAISPDQRTLYVGTGRFDVLGNGAILAYDLLPDGDVRFRSVFARIPAEEQREPDGMDVDEDGNLYVGMFSPAGQTGVSIFTPAGEAAAFVPTPGPATNLAFGIGADARTLYITAGNAVYRLPVKRRGYHPPWRRPQ